MLYLIQNDVGKDKFKNGVSRSGANWVFGGARVDENARVDEKWGYIFYVVHKHTQLISHYPIAINYCLCRVIVAPAVDSWMLRYFVA